MRDLLGPYLYPKIENYITDARGKTPIQHYNSYSDDEYNNICRLTKTLQSKAFLIAINDAYKRLKKSERKDLSFTGSFGNEKSPQGRYDETRTNYYYRVLRPLLCYEGYIWNIEHQKPRKPPWPLLSGVSSVHHDTEMEFKKNRRVSLSHLKDKYRSVDLWKLKVYELRTVEYLNIVDSISYTLYYRYKKVAFLYVDPKEKDSLRNSYRIICGTFPSSVLDISDMELMTELINFYKNIKVSMILINRRNHRNKITITSTIEEYISSTHSSEYTSKSRFVLNEFCRAKKEFKSSYHRLRFLLLIAEKFIHLISDDLRTVSLLLHELYSIDMDVDAIRDTLREIKKMASK